ncbi:hypothetical protein WOLCODRAFT_137973, partial [Wolfiporia cocos MD-104 SS10]
GDTKDQNFNGLCRKDEELFKVDLFGNSEKVSTRVTVQTSEGGAARLTARLRLFRQQYTPISPHQGA